MSLALFLQMGHLGNESEIYLHVPQQRQAAQDYSIDVNADKTTGFFVQQLRCFAKGTAKS